jgi:DNA invertase Pin-like site-specific DNA recombinase
MVWYNETTCKDKRANNSGRFPKKEIDHEYLKQLYHKGTPIKEIAIQFNCSIPTIKRHLHLIIHTNLRRYKFNYSPSNEVNQNIIKLYTNHHYSTEKIADIVGLCDETIRRRLQKLGIELRGKSFKNLETFHPSRLNRYSDKSYPYDDLNEFNNKLAEMYCLMHSQKTIARTMGIDRGTARRRINFLKSQHRFKMRFCKRCNDLFRFRITKHQKNSNICPQCRLS